MIDYLIGLYKYEVINNKDFMDRVKHWLSLSREIKECSYCGNLFSILSIPDHIYSACTIKDCCFLCNIVEFPSKELARSRIRNFIDACGVIPSTNDGITNYYFMSQIPRNKYRDVIIAYAKMGRQKHIVSIFGSWFEGLVYSGSLPENVLRTKRGIKCIASDGHVCLSLAELRIDEWLTSHNIKHDKEPLYPQHDVLNPSERLRGDWLVNKTYIEYFGLTGENLYDSKMERKLRILHESETPFISILPNDLGNLEALLHPLTEKKQLPNILENPENICDKI